MNKEKITRYQWKKYLQLQRKGIINMADIQKVSKLIGELTVTAKAIQENYEWLKQKYGI